MMVLLPTNPTTITVPDIVDMANGFVILPAERDVTIGIAGVATNAHKQASFMMEEDSLIIEFFDQSGASSTASNVSVTLSVSGATGTVDVSVDDGSPTTESAIPGTAVPLTTASAHKIQVTVPLGDPARIAWTELSYDHDCL